MLEMYQPSESGKGFRLWEGQQFCCYGMTCFGRKVVGVTHEGACSYYEVWSAGNTDNTCSGRRLYYVLQ